MRTRSGERAVADARTHTVTVTDTAAPGDERDPPRARGACDAPLMIAERYLQDEGFTDIQLTGSGGVAGLVDGKADLAAMFMPTVVTAVDGGKPVVSIGGLHTGCAEIWAPPGVTTLKELRGRTVVVQAKTPENLAYSYIAIGLKNAGVDPSEVNFVVQPDADLTKMFLDGKSDLLFLATTGAFAFQDQPRE